MDWLLESIVASDCWLLKLLMFVVDDGESEYSNPDQEDFRVSLYSSWFLYRTAGLIHKTDSSVRTCGRKAGLHPWKPPLSPSLPC